MDFYINSAGNIYTGDMQDGDRPATQEEIDAHFNPPKTAEEIRTQRDTLLAATDYLVMPDYPLNEEQRNAVIAYRQALRDVLEQAGFPEEIIWPEKP